MLSKRCILFMNPLTIIFFRFVYRGNFSQCSQSDATYKKSAIVYFYPDSNMLKFLNRDTRDHTKESIA
jgi:hypothetical protein